MKAWPAASRKTTFAPMGRPARGVRGMDLEEGDYLVGAEVVGKEGLILSISENGYGKRTPLVDYRLTARGRKGVINMKTTPRIGKVVGILSVKEDSELMIITKQGQIIRIDSSEIRQAGRSTQGVRLVNVEEGDQVAAASLIPEAEGGGATARGSAAAVARAYNRSMEQKEQASSSPRCEQMGSVIVAYSGGADSAYLAWAAHRVLGDKAIAITADSASLPESHKRDAEAFAREHGFRHEYIATREFDNPDYVKNDPDRCFHCKDELFTRLDEVARERGIAHVIYGVNVDDLGDYRPGQRAAKLHQVKAPLVDAGLTKAEIRELSQRAGLTTWDRPASACLSSRIPYGTPVTIENVKTVERGEEAIRALGFRQFRVRFHGDWCGSRSRRKNWTAP